MNTLKTTLLMALLSGILVAVGGAIGGSHGAAIMLLISLGIVGIGYGKWFKWSAKIQAAVLALTCALLLFANAIGY